jgi:formimidoylglutamate deiminase
MFPFSHTHPMLDVIVPHALLPAGWAEGVRLTADAAGTLVRVEAGAEPDSAAERIEGVALPGMPNLHSHAFQRALAGLTERQGGGTEDSFWSWRSAMYGFLGRLTPDDVEAIAGQLYVEMLRAGYTSVAEFHYLHRAADGGRYDDPAEMSRRVLAAADASGIALTLLPVVYMTGDFGGAPPGEGQRRFLLDPDGLSDLLERLAPELDGGRRLGVALHSLRAVPPDAIPDALAALERVSPGGPVHVHVAEQRREVEACLAWSGTRPVEWLLEHAPVDARWCLVHATHVTPSEVRRLAASGAVAGLCPTTEANLGDGIFPLRDYLASEGAIGIGSDSHVSVSPVEELRWLEYGQRLVGGARNVASGFPHPSTGRTLFEAAASGGARAMGIRAGALEVGRRADIVVLDPEHPVLAGRSGDALLDSWLFSGNRPSVRHVAVGGRWVVRDGRHPSQQDVLARYRRTVRGLA